MKAICEDSAEMKALPWRASVADIVARWPHDVPLASLISGGDSGAWSRWSVLAAPVATITTLDEAQRALAVHPRWGAAKSPDAPPFQRGWIGWVGYDVGRRFEPSAMRSTGAVDDRRWPLLCLHRCEGAYAHDHVSGRWWIVGSDRALPRIALDEPVSPTLGATIEPVQVSPGADDRGSFEARVQRAVKYVHAGDVFQVNVARRVSHCFSGSSRAMALRLIERMGPWMGAIIEGPSPGQSVLSVSPELLWRIDAGSGRIVTRPIKGTTPADRDPEALAASEKDRAELMMIIDLMRNDLGRVCSFGSVRVREARSIERHGSATDAGVWHGVATIEGTLRPDVSLWETLQACFPAGSITGAPKIRAMQIIDELEPVRRGPYCGSVGYFDDSGASALNVAIRTAAIDGESMGGSYSNLQGMLDYWVGAGIVADSVPSDEWAETCAKAAGFQEAIAGLAPRAAGVPE